MQKLQQLILLRQKQQQQQKQQQREALLRSTGDGGAGCGGGHYVADYGYGGGDEKGKNEKGGPSYGGYGGKGHDGAKGHEHSGGKGQDDGKGHSGGKGQPYYQPEHPGMPRCKGRLKLYNVEKGYGFLTSRAILVEYGRDVFLHRKQLERLMGARIEGDVRAPLGDQFSFVIIKNWKVSVILIDIELNIQI